MILEIENNRLAVKHLAGYCGHVQVICIVGACRDNLNLLKCHWGPSVLGIVFKHENEDYVTKLSQINKFLIRPAFVALMVAGIQGCAMSSFTSGFGGGMFGSKKKPAISSSGGQMAPVSQAGLLNAAQSDNGGNGTDAIGSAAGCPKFLAWPEGRLYTQYESGHENSSLGIMYRGEITKTARECQVKPGSVGMRYGFAGRVLLGSRGRDGNVRLPVLVHVTDRNHNKIKTDRITVNVNVTKSDPIGFFSIVKVVKFDVAPGSRPLDYRVYVAFEQPKSN